MARQGSRQDLFWRLSGVFTMVRLASFQAFLIAILVSSSGGCTSTPGRGFTLFPADYKMIDSAKNLRYANAQPLLIARELEKQPLPPFAVEPGDVLLVQPLDLDSPVRLPGDQPVLPDGTINLGKYGQLQVSGKTVPE